MKIIILDTNTLTRGDLDFSCIDQLGDTTYYNVLPPEEIVPRCKDADALLINKAEMTREVIQSLPRLKYIGLFATGYNNVDLAAASEYGVSVVNIPGYSTDAVSQHVFALILSYASNAAAYNDAVHRGEWSASGSFSFFPYPITELAGKTLGIVGFGNIGRKTAGIGQAFGMNILVHSRTRKEGCPYRQCDLDTLLGESDYVTLHCPLNEASAHLINRETLKKMKPSAFLVNTSRGGVVDSLALAEALNDEIIAGAGIDVLPTEPMKADDPLLSAKNCIITPHIAWAAIESRRRCVSMAAENLKAFQEGHPQNVVNRTT